ncbi:MAG TPA: type II toxin-antitoxin system RelE/ParE family toxin [Longimicrobium sp.]|jgi:putative component of toxin-antitoxin plasmid stabilization module|uniref:type II toxin-antitoxin system RelE/ParE family toxin n=1 Tax=Longimicrobium sp. TaxID=2029185 RepID=UPI002ED86D19
MSDLLEVVPTVWYMAEVRALARKERDRIDRKLISLARKGWSAAVADLSVKHLRDGIYEFRILGRGAAFRILFFLAPGRSPRLVVLTTCASKSVMQKKLRLDTEVERAAGRRMAWLEQQRKGGE